MEDVQENAKTLVWDETRRANASIRGYLYQIIYSSIRWLNLKDSELICFERAEDVDIQEDGSFNAIQVKNTSANITLRSEDVLSSINNFWKLSQDNPKQNIYFHYWTTSERGTETSNSFGGIKGLDQWDLAKRTLSEVDKLSSFLCSLNINNELKDFLKVSSKETIREKLILKIDWLTARPQFPVLEKELENALARWGNRFNLLPSACIPVKEALIHKVMGLASSPSPQPVTSFDLLLFLDSRIQTSVPLAQHMALQNSLEIILGKISDTGGALLTRSINLLSPITNLSIRTISRKVIIDKLSQDLLNNAFLFVSGSMDTGKTTLALLLARSIPANWVVCSLAEYTDQTEDHVLDALATELEIRSEIDAIIIDDVKFSPGRFDKVLPRLNTILRIIQARRGFCIVLTEQIDLKSGLLSIGYPEQVFYNIPYFDMHEIEDLLSEFGYSQKDSIKYYASILMIYKGHPRLTYAAISSWDKRAWDLKFIGDLIAGVPAISDIKQAARRIIGDSLSDGEKQLIYRCDAFVLDFKKNHALRIASKDPAISIPGEQLDKLLGTWIEVLANGRFRLSPLIDGIIKEIFSPDDCAAWRIRAIESIIEDHTIDFRDALNVLQLSIMARHSAAAAPIIHKLIDTPDEARTIVAKLILYICYVRSEDSLFFDSIPVNMLFHVLQIRVSAIEDPQLGVSVFSDWKRDLNLVKSDAHYAYYAFMYSVHALIYSQIPLSGEEVVYAIKLYYDTKFSARKIGYDLSELDSEDDEEETAESIFFLSSIIRSTGRNYVLAFISNYYLIPNECKILLFPGEDLAIHRWQMFANSVWMKEKDKVDPDWNKCLNALDVLKHEAINLSIDFLVIACIKSISVILDEYLNDFEQAEKTLLKGLRKFPNNRVLCDALAMVKYRKNEWSYALFIYFDIFKNWKRRRKNTDFSALASLRRAAISSAKKFQWHQAFYFFKKALDAVDANMHDYLVVGLKADGADRLYRAHMHYLACPKLFEVFYLLKDISNSQDDIARFSLHKCIGLAVMHICQDLDLIPKDENYYELPIGICSSTDYNDQILTLPKNDEYILWYFYYQYESTVMQNPFNVAHLEGMIDSDVGVDARKLFIKSELIRVRMVYFSKQLDPSGFIVCLEKYMLSLLLIVPNNDQLQEDVLLDELYQKLNLGFSCI